MHTIPERFDHGSKFIVRKLPVMTQLIDRAKHACWFLVICGNLFRVIHEVASFLCLDGMAWLLYLVFIFFKVPVQLFFYSY